jgi:hypothetical protein
MLRASLPQLWRQVFGGKNRSRTANCKPRSVRLAVEILEDRDLPSLVHIPIPVQNLPVLSITSASLVNANDQPLTVVTAGEQVYVQANFTTQRLPSSASYHIIYTVNGITKETGSLTWGAGGSGTGSWIAYWGSWTAALGTNQVTVTTSYGDNSKSFSFTASPGPVANLVLSAPATTNAGASFQVSVKAEDAYGNQTPYTGTCTLYCTLCYVNNPPILSYAVPLTNGQGSTTVTLSQVGTFQLDVCTEIAGRFIPPKQLAYIVVNPALPPASSYIQLTTNQLTPNDIAWYLQNNSDQWITVYWTVTTTETGPDPSQTTVNTYHALLGPHQGADTNGVYYYANALGDVWKSTISNISATYSPAP